MIIMFYYYYCYRPLACSCYVKHRENIVIVDKLHTFTKQKLTLFQNDIISYDVSR